MSVNPLDFPVVEGRTITQGHADYCQAHGHATHTVDGVVSPWCPRCGDNLPNFLGEVSDETENTKGFVTSTAGIRLLAERSVAGGVRARYDERAAWWYITSQRVAMSFRPACPRCGRDRMQAPDARNSVSRKDNETLICNACGGDEAMIDFGIGEADVWPGFPGLLVR